MEFKKVLENVNQYFEEKLKSQNNDAKDLNWVTNPALEMQFEQLSKVIEPGTSFSLLDYGAGFGNYYQYLVEKAYKVRLYYGFDLLEFVVQEERKRHDEDSNVIFTTDLSDCTEVDYVVACGVFDMKLNADHEQWTKYVLRCIEDIDEIATKGFALNFPSKYTPEDKKRDDIYYADPCCLFDYCKLHFSPHVAILHDYDMENFTVIIRK